MNTIICYHSIKPGIDCPDGIMAAAIAKLKYPDAQLHPHAYGQDPADLETKLTSDTRLIIVDFSFPAEVLNRWENMGVELSVIDHHAQQFPMLEGFSGAILDAEECGASLTWKHFFPDKPKPPILKHVRRRDIGADGYYKAPENCRDSKAVTAKLGANRANACEYGGDVIEYLQSVLEYDDYAIFEHLEKPGEGMLKAEEKAASDIAATAFRTRLPDPVGVECWGVKIENVEHDRLVSQIGAAVSQREGVGTICWIQTSEGLNSIRSNGVDISGYAKELGGGGHPQAAGFSKGYEFPA